jgi:hypothetical protein
VSRRAIRWVAYTTQVALPTTRIDPVPARDKQINLKRKAFTPSPVLAEFH